MSTGYEVRYEQQAREILKGGYDIHIHAAPDGFLRNVDCFDAARDAGGHGNEGDRVQRPPFPYRGPGRADAEGSAAGTVLQAA